MNAGDLPPDTGLNKRLPGARLALCLLLAVNLFNYIDRQVLSATIPEIEKQLLPAGGDNKAKLGLLSTAFMVSYMVFALPFGWLADRMPRWYLIGLGVIVWSLASGASGLAGTLAAPPFNQGGLAVLLGTFGFLLLTRCLVGIGEAAYGPVAPDMISDLYPVRQRGYVLAWFYAAIPVGSALGYVIGGEVTKVWGWPWAFYLVVPPGLLLGILCFFMHEPKKGGADLPGSHSGQPIDAPRTTHITGYPNPPAMHAHTAPKKAGFKDYLILARTPSYVLDCLGMAMMTFALGGIAVWMPDYVTTRLLKEYSPAQLQAIGNETAVLAHVNRTFGLIVVVAGLVATILGGLTGDWLRKYLSGSYFIVSATAMFLGFPLFVAVLYAPFPLAWVLIFVTCFCLFFNTGPSNTILANVTHPSMRASAFAINIFVIHVLGDAISPPIIGAVADAYPVDGRGDLKMGFLAVSGTILLGGIFWFIGSFFLARDTALAPHRLDAKSACPG